MHILIYFNCQLPVERAVNAMAEAMMKKLFILKLIILCCLLAAAAQDDTLVGSWKGVIQAGGRKFTFVFKFSSVFQKGIQGFLDLPEQDEQNIPIDNIKITEDKVYLVIEKIQRKYEGHISPDKKKIVGVYIRNEGTRLSLMLERMDSVFSMKRPQIPQPPYPYKEDPVVIVNKDDKTRPIFI